MSIIEKIRAEVERLYDEANNYDDSRHYLGEVLSFLSDLEKECQWSAEDETKIAYICDVMSGKELVSDISPSYRSEIIEFAKSLRPAKVKSEKPINPVIQDFPTTEKEMQDFLATHERIPVPERLNSLERILQEQPVKIDIRKELASIEFMGVNDARDSETIARHFYELGRQSGCVKVKAESSIDKFILENCTHCTIEHCPGMRKCYTSSNKQLQ